MKPSPQCTDLLALTLQIAEVEDLLAAEDDAMSLAVAANVPFKLLPRRRQAVLLMLCFYLGAERLRHADNLWAAVATEQWGAAGAELLRLDFSPLTKRLADALVRG